MLSSGYPYNIVRTFGDGVRDTHLQEPVSVTGRPCGNTKPSHTTNAVRNHVNGIPDRHRHILKSLISIVWTANIQPRALKKHARIKFLDHLFSSVIKKKNMEMMQMLSARKLRDIQKKMPKESDINTYPQGAINREVKQTIFGIPIPLNLSQSKIMMCFCFPASKIHQTYVNLYD